MQDKFKTQLMKLLTLDWLNGDMSDPERFISKLFLGLISLLPIIAIFSHRTFGPALYIAMIICAFLSPSWSGYRQYFLQPILKGKAFHGYDRLTHSALLLFTLWTMMTLAWTPISGRFALTSGLFFIALAGGTIIWHSVRLPKAIKSQLADIYAIAIIIALVVLGFETLTGGFIRAIVPPTDDSLERHKDLIALARGTTAMMVMIFPAMIITHLRTGLKWPLLVIFVIAGVSAYGLGVSANLLGLIGGCFAGLIAWRWPSTTIACLFVLLGVCLWIMPLVAINLSPEMLAQLSGAEFSNHKVPTSWLQRLYIWESLGQEIPNAMPLGQGVDYTRWLSRNSGLFEVPGVSGVLKLVPTHPHNVFLQIWLELGVVGAVIVSTLLYGGGKWVLSKGFSRPLMTALAGIMAASLVSFLIEASFWQVWRLAAIVFACFGLALLSGEAEPSKPIDY